MEEDQLNEYSDHSYSGKNIDQREEIGKERRRISPYVCK